MKLLTLIFISVFLFGCSTQQDTAKTKQEAADAAAKLKQESKDATIEIKKGAKEAARQGRAIAEGVREGWKEGDQPVNVNSASKDQLMSLPGMDTASADHVIAGRPYHTVDEVGARGAVSPEEFQQIKNKITVK